MRKVNLYQPLRYEKSKPLTHCISQCSPINHCMRFSSSCKVNHCYCGCFQPPNCYSGNFQPPNKVVNPCQLLSAFLICNVSPTVITKILNSSTNFWIFARSSVLLIRNVFGRSDLPLLYFLKIKLPVLRLERFSTFPQSTIACASPPVKSTTRIHWTGVAYIL